MDTRAAALALLLIGSAPYAAFSQGTTDIFLADLVLAGDRVEVGTPVNVTKREGYDNQPWFVPDGSAFLYVSQRDGQTDVFRYEIAAGRSTRVTATPDNEYSPSLTPEGSRMLVVRWAADMSAGALWWYTPGGDPVEEVRGSVPRTGYYAVVGGGTLALFINDSIQSFMLADTVSGDAVRVGAALGGSGPRAIPGEAAVSFLREDAEGSWWLTRLDVATLETKPLVRMLEGVNNYTWVPGGMVLAARGGTIYRWRGGGDWTPVAEFTDPSLQGITRLAVSPGGARLALVSASGTDVP
jgi:dipeptidyl aminopeptidase/acylaminoacyl peptidase